MPIKISDLDFPKFKGITDIDSLAEQGIKPLIEWVVIFSIVVAVVLIIVSGYNMITSTGDPEKIKKGQRGLTAAIIGLIIVFVARLIVSFVLDIIVGK